ncbi:MAG: septal ring lytic transglycosylase RlpA family protein [Raineya sp.]|nr:septal ring lytic transglycosylase RlpA family protein [Raineya sp.]
MKTYFLLILLCLQISENFAQGQKFTQTGVASYYAGRFNGRKTSSGEIYDSKKFTAAHRTLKFGTMVKVTNLKNNRSVIVKINDRGPFAHNRIIDISQAAAQEIDMLKTGTAQVRIEVVGENGKLFELEPSKEPKKDTTIIAQNNSKPTPTPAADTTFLTGNTYSLWGTKKNPKGMGIQVGSYGDLENAKDLCKDLQKAGIQETYIQVGWNQKRIYRVLVGAFNDEETGRKQLEVIRKAGFDGFVKKHFD